MNSYHYHYYPFGSERRAALLLRVLSLAPKAGAVPSAQKVGPASPFATLDPHRPPLTRVFVPVGSALRRSQRLRPEAGTSVFVPVGSALKAGLIRPFAVMDPTDSGTTVRRRLAVRLIFDHLLFDHLHLVFDHLLFDHLQPLPDSECLPAGGNTARVREAVREIVAAVFCSGCCHSINIDAKYRSRLRHGADTPLTLIVIIGRYYPPSPSPWPRPSVVWIIWQPSHESSLLRSSAAADEEGSQDRDP